MKNIVPAKDSSYFSYNENFLTELPNKKYVSEIFVITPGDTTGDHASFIDLMNEIHHPDSELVPYGDKFTTKSWNKSGDLLVHVEYYRLIEPEEKGDEELEF